MALAATRERMTVPITSSFDEFYRTEWSRVLGLVYALSGSKWAAEDVTQEAFLRAHRDWERVAAMDHPGSWVRTVALNLARSGLRRRGAEFRAVRRWVGFQVTAFPEMESASEDFWRAVRSLPRRQAEVVALHYGNDMAVRDVAAVLGIAESTVKTSLQKGRATLAKRFDPDEVQP
jgi:RNA polymerase sigma-70 factor (ECF subfamily)